MNKNIIKIVGLTIGVLLPAVVVFADTASSTPSSISTQTQPNLMRVAIEQSGRGQLAGTLVSVSGTTLTVSSWGGNWMIDASQAKLIRRYGGTSSLSEFQAGDNLQIQGNVSQSAAWTIVATIIKDNSIQAQGVNVNGTISNLNASANSFTLTSQNNQSVQVTLGSNGKVTVNDKVGSFSDLTNGIAVRVKGVLDRNSKTISATQIDYRQQMVSVSGAISNLNTSALSFTLTTDKGNFQVTLASGARIMINNGAASFSDLQNGMQTQVRGYGDKNLMVVTANIVRARFNVRQQNGNQNSTSSSMSH